jgi:hypothetical protein
MMSKSAQKVGPEATNPISASRRGLIAGGLALALVSPLGRTAQAAAPAGIAKVRVEMTLDISTNKMDQRKDSEIGPFKTLGGITTQRDLPTTEGVAAERLSTVRVLLADGPEVTELLDDWYKAGLKVQDLSSRSGGAASSGVSASQAIRQATLTVVSLGGNRRWVYAFSKVLVRELELETQGDRQVIGRLELEAADLAMSYSQRPNSGSPWSNPGMSLASWKGSDWKWDIQTLTEKP